MTLIQTFDTLTNRTSHSLVSAQSDNAISDNAISDNAISDNAISHSDLPPDSHSDLPPDSHHRPHHSSHGNEPTDLLGSYINSGIQLPPLPIVRPLLMVGHGTRNPRGRQDLIDFANIYQELDASRPVIPCFLELTEPSIQAGVDQCISQGYTDISVLPILLFAARHNKFDVTNELDRAKARYPQLTFHYGRHFGITPAIFELWQARLALLDTPDHNPNGIAREDTVLLFIGRGSSDPDANGDVYKLARMMWEGSGYHTVETCFIGITHPRLEEGFRRSRLYRPKRIIVLPYFMFTGVLMEKIERIAVEQQLQYPDTEVAMLPEMGIHPLLLSVLRDREIETQQGNVQMNCEMCKFRIVATTAEQRSGHGHSHDHDFAHGHAHHDSAHDHAHHSHDHNGHDHNGHAHHNPDHNGHAHNGHAHNSHDHSANVDPYAEPEKYHNRIWQVP